MVQLYWNIGHATTTLSVGMVLQYWQTWEKNIIGQALYLQNLGKLFQITISINSSSTCLENSTMLNLFSFRELFGMTQMASLSTREIGWTINDMVTEWEGIVLEMCMKESGPITTGMGRVWWDGWTSTRLIMASGKMEFRWEHDMVFLWSSVLQFCVQ